jgi:hypothetical protein
VWRVARYRFRATFRRRWGGYLAVTLLIALLGGIAMGAVAGARRNQSAYPAFLASTHPSDLTLPTALYSPALGFKTGYDPAILAKIRRLPHVKRVESSVELNSGPVDAGGKPLKTPPNFNVGSDDSLDGLFFDQNRITITQGRMADPARADEMVVSAGVAKVLAADGIHLGGIVHSDIFSNAQSNEPLNVLLAHPYRRIDLRVVGVGVLSNAVIQDDVDVIGSEFTLQTPALARQLLQCCIASTLTGIELDGGSRYVGATEAGLQQINPLLSRFSVASIAEAKVERAVKPESIAFGVFGLIAALAALLIAGQAIGRQLGSAGDDLEVLRALGAGPAMTGSDGLIGVIGAVVIGAVLAGAVALGLSPLAPIGPARRVYPTRGVAFDATVLGIGVAVLIVALTAVAVGLAYRNAPHRVARRSTRLGARRSRAARLTARSGLSAPATTGIRFALEPGRGKNAVPVRSAILGTVLAMVVVVGAVTFGASLHTLVARPPLYGWNWNYALSGGSGVGAIPDAASAKLLDHDHDVAAWSGVYFTNTQIDGQPEPIIGGGTNAPVGPPLLSGHALEAANQIVLGSLTLSQLHKHLGQTVEVSNGSPKPVRLRIVGTATMPAVGPESNPSHATMGIGALVAYQLIPAQIRDSQGNLPAGPNDIFVRLRPGVNTKAALHTLNQIATKLSLPTNYGVEVLPVQRPAEIVNYRSMSNTPIVLGAGLAIGAIAALALTLIASVRRRRRELALLKTLGFTRRQLAAVVAWQSTVAVAIGVVIGVPLGIVAGRSLWDVFAREIHAVPAPTAPAVSIMLVALAALVLANVVAAIPGRQAARTPTALLLHAE